MPKMGPEKINWREATEILYCTFAMGQNRQIKETDTVVEGLISS